MTPARRPWTDWTLAAGAMAWLVFAAAAIRLLPFDALVRLAGWPLGANPPTPAGTVARVRWAMLAAARRAPWPPGCFEQGLAAQIMLRRRGVASSLHYGAAREMKGALAAHVWVRDGGVDLIGGEAANGFASLAVFPPPSRARRGDDG